MSRNIHISEPTAEMQIKMKRACLAIAQQKKRMVKCPYCQHNAIGVFEDARGHIETKCKKCGRVSVIDVLSMRRLRVICQ